MNINVQKVTSILILAFAIVISGCGDDNPMGTDTGDGDNEAQIPEAYQNLPGTIIAEDETWSSDTTLVGPHFVLPGVTLSVEPGVTVSFKYHNNNADYVGTIITLDADSDSFDDGPRPSGRLVADGTADKPIVFTSARSNPQKNDWGGIILVGHAPNNIPGGRGEVEGLSDAIQYGGDNDKDDSGILRYVRIEYSGYSIAEGSELQALTLYSVGSGTTIENISVYEVSDDGIEIFGGTVDIKYLVVYGADDDSFDYDQGWQGRGQFWLAVQSEGADNGFENDGCDDLSNCGGGNGPTSPQIYNVTVYGAGDGSSPNKNNFGLRLRENLQGSYNNIVLANLDGAPFVLEGGDSGEEGDATYTNYSNQLGLSSFIVWINDAFQNKSGSDGVATESDATRYTDSYEELDPMFSDPAGYDFSLQAGSPALGGARIPPDDGFFESVEFRGAFGTENWAAGWARLGQ